MIFHRLKARGHDWIYVFPKLYLVDLRPWHDAEQGATDSAWDHSASEEVGAPEEDLERGPALAELRESLGTSPRQAMQAARQAPPPPTVQAYQSIYGWFPAGWPPAA